jgi:hypothetical protein
MIFPCSLLAVVKWWKRKNRLLLIQFFNIEEFLGLIIVRFEKFHILSESSVETDLWSSNKIFLIQMMVIWKTQKLNKVSLLALQVILFHDINKIDWFLTWRTSKDFFLLHYAEVANYILLVLWNTLTFLFCLCSFYIFAFPFFTSLSSPTLPPL